MRICTYDIEIAKNIEELPNGWSDARKGLAGISSIVLYDTLSGRYHIYGPALARIKLAVDHLNSADLLVGFNNIEFDAPVLEAVSGQKIVVPQVDLLKVVWGAIKQKHKGWGLKPICKRTLGLDSPDTGAHAPDLFKEGRFDELHDYNLSDVYLTRMLFNHILDESFVLGPDMAKVEMHIDGDLEYA